MPFRIRTVWRPFAYAAAISAVSLILLIFSVSISDVLIIFFAFSPIAFVIIADMLARHRAKLFELEDKINKHEFRISILEQRSPQAEPLPPQNTSNDPASLLSQLP